MAIHCGIDFGTTNTVVSICNSQGVLVDSFSLPTTVYIPYIKDHIRDIQVGKNAWYSYQKNREGRLIHSIKRTLSDKDFTTTKINDVEVTIESLVTLFMKEVNKIIMERWCIQPESIVLGRPVRFSLDEEADDLANTRLLAGFKKAGYHNITQLEEPIAAAYCFEEYLSEEDQHFILVDLGGGTSDFSFIKRDLSKEGIDRFKVLSTEGIDIGGDHFDEELMFNKVSPLLGRDSTYESYGKRRAMPIHLYRDISRWNHLYQYNRLKLSEDFRDYLYDSNDYESVVMLKNVIDNRLSHSLLDRVRDTKHSLSENHSAMIEFNQDEVILSNEVSLKEYSQMLEDKVESILNVLNNTISGNKTIADRVILTGGSSKNLIIYNKILELVDEKKILMDDNFYNSVSKGMALFAQYKNL